MRSARSNAWTTTNTMISCLCRSECNRGASTKMKIQISSYTGKHMNRVKDGVGADSFARSSTAGELHDHRRVQTNEDRCKTHRQQQQTKFRRATSVGIHWSKTAEFCIASAIRSQGEAAGVSGFTGQQQTIRFRRATTDAATDIDTTATKDGQAGLKQQKMTSAPSLNSTLLRSPALL